ncbi:MAG: hypothetical protein E6Q97_07790 [Desulfurellales bacterium]|nr:MAG: hypothetical protein E6Q97_07790 [Desulfurellales bacterium]
MAKVPYSAVPSAEPQMVATPDQRVSVSGAAFGADVANAIGHLGQTVEKAGDQMFARAIAIQQVNNKAEADEADAKYMMEAGKLQADFNSLQGKDAVDRYPHYIKSLQELRLNVRKDLSNQASQKMFDSASLSTMGRTVFNGAGHAASQNRRYVIGASQARIDATTDYVRTNPRDENAFRDGMRTMEGEVRGTQRDVNGWSPEQTEEAVSKNRSSMWSNRIAGLARTEPFAAKKMLDENRAALRGEDADRVEGVVRSNLNNVGARNIEAEVNSDLRTDPSGRAKTLLERQNEAREKAKAIDPDNVVFQDMAVQRVLAGYNQSIQAKRDLDLDNINTISEALMKGGPGGKLPTTVDELTAVSPQVASAWEELEPSKQRSFMRALSQNAKGDVAWTQAGLKRYQQLVGMAQSSPDEFLDVDVTAENIPNSAKVRLVGQQAKAKAAPEGDPRVRQAMSTLLPLLGPVGLGSRTTQNQADYDQFVGALADQMHEYEDVFKKRPQGKDLQDMAGRLLQQMHSPEFMLPWSKDYMYKMPIPDEVLTRAKTEFKAKNGYEPSDDAIRREYIRQQYQKLYGKPQRPEAKS